MFIIGSSTMALLNAAVSICHLPYASLITEIADDSTVLCGVELELPQLDNHTVDLCANSKRILQLQSSKLILTSPSTAVESLECHQII
ncbi:hypothetical protein GQ55_9G356200 [Panicum hallii var. hallii]|uniref:Uncharacterized protein n=1 Tax=Panicum hallii var. hallii TaxID=1504633 RepID=A0A2T7C8P3_9POAL|nr:hypothetical protein GQ55_9G356200 [Panicum hallii var. hallii]